jgi:hypothetical protein
MESATLASIVATPLFSEALKEGGKGAKRAGSAATTQFALR